MNYLKKISKSLLLSFISFFLVLFLLTSLQYFDWLSNTFFNILSIIMIFICFLSGGIIFGKKSNQKGWLEGIKLSLIEIIIFVIINLIIDNSSVKNFIFYIVIFFATTIGSIIGVNNNNISK